MADCVCVLLLVGQKGLRIYNTRERDVGERTVATLADMQHFSSESPVRGIHSDESSEMHNSSYGARHGYWSVKSYDKLSILTTFNIPFGRCCRWCTQTQNGNHPTNKDSEECDRTEGVLRDCDIHVTLHPKSLGTNSNIQGPSHKPGRSSTERYSVTAHPAV